MRRHAPILSCARPLADVALALALALALACSPRAATPAPPELWFYQSANLADTAVVNRTEALWRRAAAAGYSRVVLADARFARPSAQDAAYLAHVTRLRALAEQLKLEIIPGVFTLGREDGALLAEDANLAEALPVRDAKFVVHGGVASLVADPPVTLPAVMPVIEGVSAQAGGVITMRDHTGRLRAGAVLTLAPWRFYHISVAIRTQDWSGVPQLRVTSDGRELAFARLGVQRTQVWTTHDVTFFSLAHTRVQVSFGDWHAAKGTLEWRDWLIEEAGPVNLVRRAQTPFTFSGRTEGRDFAFVRDSLLGRSPSRGRFDAWHTPPTIRTSLPEGTELRGSWWAAAVVGGHQVAACASDSAVLRRYSQEGRRVREMFGAHTMMLMHDEIRALGGDPACVAAGGNAGAILAANVRACRKAVQPAAAIVWGDMFDPEQNAVAQYYLESSDLTGSWNGLDRDVAIMNWNHEHLEHSLRFFADRGHTQIIAAYYDGPLSGSAAWLPLLDRVPGLRGVMYATWQDRYDDLEAFAKLVRHAPAGR